MRDVNNAGTLCPYCEEYAKPHEWIRAEQERDALRADNARLRDALSGVDMYFGAIDGFSPNKDRGESGRVIRSIVSAALAASGGDK